VAGVPCSYLIVVTGYGRHGPVLRLSGELDVCGTDLLESAISVALDSRPRKLVLDLSELTFMDCAGASVLRRTHDLMAARQAQLLVNGARPNVQRLFDLLGLNAYLRLSAGGGKNHPQFCWK
jgi:anti-anti-sigma factor